jgi:hypothetical protein
MNLAFNPLKTEGILRKFQKVTQIGAISKIMISPENLSQYLSNEYQCFNGVIKLPIFLAF